MPTCKEDARPVVFITVGCASRASLSGTMSIDPRSDASSGAAYMLVTVLAMAFVFGEGEASGVAGLVGVDVAWVELF